MTLDILFAIFFIAGFYYGYQKGIVNTIFSVLGFMLGTIILTKFNEQMLLYLTKHTQVNPAFLPVLSILLLIIFIALLFKLLSWSSEQLLKTFHLSSVNKIIGGALFATLVAFLYSTLMWYANKANYIEEETKEKSKTYSFIQPLSPMLTDAIGAAIPAFQGMYKNMDESLDSMNVKHLNH